MASIKKILKNTPLYKIFNHFRNKKIIKQWTVHDQKMLTFYSQFITPDKLAFDVGANIGNRVKILLKLGAKVIAIEPQNECVNVLNSCLGKNKHLTIIQKVLGSSVGEATLMTSDTSTIASMSSDWIKAVQSSGRFSDHSWESEQAVSMTTLDQLIERYGTPTFIKIDVEGFEYEVISGLSKPIPYISLEFAPEFIHSTFKCIEHLESLGDVVFNYSLDESMQFELKEYVTSKVMRDILNGYEDNNTFGDVYCQFTELTTSKQ